MEPMAGKERCDSSTMNCASCVTNESCDSAGRSSKIVSRRTPGIYTRIKHGMVNQTKRKIGIRACLLEEHMRSQRMGVIELIGQDFGYRDRRLVSDPLHRRNLFPRKRSRDYIKHKVAREKQKRQTSDSMMRVGICESATRAMR